MGETPTVHEALAAVMAEVQGVGKHDEHKAPGAHFKFRGIDAVVNAAGPALRKHRVVVVPQLQSVERRDVTTSGGKASRETTVLVKYVWIGPDGSTIESIVPGEAMDNGDKGTAKAMSVAFRIALLQCLSLPTDDPDPDSQSYEREPRQSPQRQAQRPARQQEPDPEPETPEHVVVRGLIGDWVRGEYLPDRVQQGFTDVARAFHTKYGTELGEETNVDVLSDVLRKLQKDGLAGLRPSTTEPEATGE
jgi:hypothetical protein